MRLLHFRVLNRERIRHAQIFSINTGTEKYVVHLSMSGRNWNKENTSVTWSVRRFRWSIRSDSFSARKWSLNILFFSFISSQCFILHNQGIHPLELAKLMPTCWMQCLRKWTIHEKHPWNWIFFVLWSVSPRSQIGIHLNLKLGTYLSERNQSMLIGLRSETYRNSIFQRLV